MDEIRADSLQEDSGRDEIYLIADDTRYPRNGLNDFWDFSRPSRRAQDFVLAQRVRGTTNNSFRTVDVELWEDDYEPTNIWTVDDLIDDDDVDLDYYGNGDTLTRRMANGDADYTVSLHVEVRYFADPNPTSDGDSDGDHIRESAESLVTDYWNGLADPVRQETFIEVDWMAGHALQTQSKRLVTSRLSQHGIFAFIFRDSEIPTDTCLKRGEARDIYNRYFTYDVFDAFIYAVMSEQVWSDTSGIRVGDTFFVDDSTWWISGGVLAQGGTFIHELGHTMGLTQNGAYSLIDTSAALSYDSAMNYTYQATLVDYSDVDTGANDFDDWAAIRPGRGLSLSFGTTTVPDPGICN